MSHYNVYVVGDDVDHRMALYGENNPRSMELVTLQDLAEKMGVAGESALYDAIKNNLTHRDPILIVSEAMVTESDGSISEEALDWYNAGVYTLLIADSKTGRLSTLACLENHGGKWDWFEIGGRWAGHFKIKSDTIPPATAIRGGEGINPYMKELYEKFIPTKLSSYVKPAPNRFDALPKRCIDFKGMEDEWIKDPERGLRYYRARDVTQGREWKTINDCLLEIPMRRPYEIGSLAERHVKARELYSEQQVVKDLEKAVPQHTLLDHSVLRLDDKHFDSVVRGMGWQPFAMLVGEEWFERGEMGLFGLSTYKTGSVDWDLKCRELIDQIGDEEMITVVDCHI